jgi:hypothetical protein
VTAWREGLSLAGNGDADGSIIVEEMGLERLKISESGRMKKNKSMVYKFCDHNNTQLRL